jgi:hypothetical protein
MINKLILPFFALTLIAILSTGSMPEPSNPPTGNTGAPGETACMLSGCHSGGSFTGTVEISGVPDTVIANQTYTITLTNKSNAVRSGFQLTVLDTTNKFIGTLIKGTNVSIAKDNFNGRTYARQSAAQFLTNGETSWSFQWKAPASSNEKLTFYFVSMCANGDGNNSKDNSIKNTRKVIFNLPVANTDLNSNLSKSSITIQDRRLILSTTQNEVVQNLILTSLNGIQLIVNSAATDNIFDLPGNVHGIYLIQYKTDQTMHSEKVYIP